MATDPQQLLMALAGSTGLGQQIADNEQNQALGQQQAQQQLQIGQNQLDDHAAALQQAQDYQAAVQDYSQAPSVNKLVSMAGRFPQYWQQFKQAAEAKDNDVRQADAQSHFEIANAAKNGRVDLVRSLLQQQQTARKAAGQDTSLLDDALGQLNGDGDKTAALNNILGSSLASVAAHDPENFPKAAKALGFGVAGEGRKFSNTPQGFIYDESTGLGPHGESYGGGGDPTSGGGAGDGNTGSTRDTSRILNTDAGGGYVPASVKTLGQFVTYGKALNAKGTKSSSAGTYQINGSTMAEFAPKVLGSDWQSQPFNADSQDKVGEAIFDWAKTQPNPAAALKGRWVSLSSDKAAQLVKGSWDQAKGTIAAGETGGGAGASANAGTSSSYTIPPQGVSGYSAAAIANMAKMDKLPPGIPKEVRAAVMNQKAAAPSVGGDGLIAGMAPQALDNAAYQYNRTGKFPSNLGRGGEAQRAIMNRAAQLAAGQDPSQILTGQAQLNADKGSLNTLERNTGNVLAFERTALRNGALAVRKAITVDNGGVPLFNKWVNAGRQATGDPAISGFNAAVETFANEFAKVTTSATGGGVTSDSARDHARQLINTAQTPDQFFEVMKTLQTDMANRRQGLETERKAILNRISGQPLHQTQTGIPAGFRVLSVRPK